MAKKKEKDSVSSGDDIIDLIKKKHGKVYTSGVDFADRQSRILPVSPALDFGLGGGVLEGTWVTCSGRPKEGKTSTALTWAANCQKPENGGKRVFYIDVEKRFKQINLNGTAGLDKSPEKFMLIESTEEKILTGQDFLDITMDIIKTCKGCIVIVDSFSALCDSAEHDSGIEYQNRGGMNKVVSNFVRQMAQVLPVQKVTLWGMLHLAQSQSMFGSKWEEKASMPLKYQADTQLQISYVKSWSAGSGDNAKEIGKEIHWKINSSSLGKPQSDVVSYLRFGQGLDRVYELIQMASDFGVIDKSGAWYTLAFLLKEGSALTEKDVKFQGMENLVDAINNNVVWYEMLEKEVKDLIVGS